MSKAMKQDYEGQRVKVCWPGDGTVYEQDAAYVEYNEAGAIMRARRATDAEVQWWLLYTLLRHHTIDVQIREPI